MRTYQIRTPEGLLRAFEVETAYLPSLRTVHEIVAGLEGVQGITLATGSDRASGLRLTFTYLGEEYAVEEPYGDSSRYWIGPLEGEGISESTVFSVERMFQSYRPPLIMKIIGDLASLKIGRLLQR